MHYEFSGVVARKVDPGQAPVYLSLLLVNISGEFLMRLLKADESNLEYKSFNAARHHNKLWLIAAKNNLSEDQFAILDERLESCILSEEEFSELSFFWTSDTERAPISAASIRFKQEMATETEDKLDVNGNALEKPVDPLADQIETYPAYWRPLPENWTHLDYYRVRALFPLKTELPTTQLDHSLKKLLVPGVRTGGKSFYKDIKEAHATLGQWLKDNAEAADE